MICSILTNTSHSTQLQINPPHRRKINTQDLEALNPARWSIIGIRTCIQHISKVLLSNSDGQHYFTRIVLIILVQLLSCLLTRYKCELNISLLLRAAVFVYSRLLFPEHVRGSHRSSSSCTCSGRRIAPSIL